MLIVVFGLPGTGKTFFASKLAVLLDAAHLSSDEVRISIDLQGQYDTNSKETVYDTMMQQAELVLKAGKPVILDATFHKKSLRVKAKALAVKCQVDCLFIEIISGRILLRERLRRKREKSEADYEVHLLIKRLFEPMDEDHLQLESKASNINDMLKKAETWINEQADG